MTTQTTIYSELARLEGLLDEAVKLLVAAEKGSTFDCTSSASPALRALMRKEEHRGK